MLKSCDYGVTGSKIPVAPFSDSASRLKPSLFELEVVVDDFILFHFHLELDSDGIITEEARMRRDGHTTTLFRRNRDEL